MDEEVYRNSTVDKGTLKALAERSDRKGLIQFAGHVGLLLATGGLVLWTDGTPWVFPSLLGHGIALVFLFSPLHESIHRTAFRSRWLNDALARFCGAILMLPADYFRAFHFQHHRFTQDRLHDPELAGPALTSRKAYLFHVSGLPYWRERIATLCRHAGGRVTEEFIAPRQRSLVIGEARRHLAVYGLLAGLSLASDSSLLLLIWVLPALLGQPALRLYLLAEHTGCPEVPDMLANSRTTLTNGILERLCWNMNRHSAHHAYPAVPFHALPAADRLLASQIKIRCRGYGAVQRKIWSELASR